MTGFLTTWLILMKMSVGRLDNYHDSFNRDLILNESIYGQISFVIERRHEKTCLRGFRPYQVNRHTKLQKA